MSGQTRRDPESLAAESTPAKSYRGGQLPSRATTPIAGSVPRAAFAGRRHLATGRVRRLWASPLPVPANPVWTELRYGIPGSWDRVPPKVSTVLSPQNPSRSRSLSSRELKKSDFESGYRLCDTEVLRNRRPL